MSGGTSAEAPRAHTGSVSNGTKRRAYRSVQEAREKLAYKSGYKPEFEYELLMMFVKNELSAAVTTPLLAIVVEVRFAGEDPSSGNVLDDLLLDSEVVFINEHLYPAYECPD